MQLLNITDPRDNLEKAHRLELVKYAHDNGLKDITEHMPAILIRKRLRAAGLVQIQIPNRTLGQFQEAASFGGETITESPVNSVDATDDLERQYDKADYSSMKMNELRAEARKRGVKMARTDNVQSLREKLENAA